MPQNETMMVGYNRRTEGVNLVQHSLDSSRHISRGL